MTKVEADGAAYFSELCTETGTIIMDYYVFFADTWMIDASNQLPILAYGAQIVPEASPKSTGFPTALAVVAALALVKPRQPGICEATTHSQL